MKKFASINDFKEKSILLSKQVSGGMMGDCCTNTPTQGALPTFSPQGGLDPDQMATVDTETKCDPCPV